MLWVSLTAQAAYRTWTDVGAEWRRWHLERRRGALADDAMARAQVLEQVLDEVRIDWNVRFPSHRISRELVMEATQDSHTYMEVWAVHAEPDAAWLEPVDAPRVGQLARRINGLLRERAYPAPVAVTAIARATLAAAGGPEVFFSPGGLAASRRPPAPPRLWEIWR